MKHIGAHVSASGGVQNAPKNAANIRANAFALFLKNQKQWWAKPYSEEQIQQFKDRCTEYGYAPEYILPHDSYLINLGHPEQDKREKSRNAFVDELKRAEQLELTMVNFHPGNHLKQVSESRCMALVAESINFALDKTQYVTAVLENTAGQGSSVGYSFDNLAEIIEQVEDKNRVGICLDTCHAHAAGYELRTQEGYHETMAAFERIIGFSYLRGMHINDAKSELGSRIDRHHSLGQGYLGWPAFRLLMKDKRLNRIPFILETIDDSLWEQEIRALKQMEES